MGSMGVTSMTSMIACDSSFMIKSLYKFRIPGIDYDFSINTTHVALLIVSIFILVVAIIARIKINKAEASDTPGFFQNIIELIVEMLQTMVEGIMGRNANKFVNYMSTLFLFIIISNISGLFGLRPPTADYGVTLCLGLITFVLIQFNGIKKNKIRHFTALFQPIWFLFPINLIGEFAVPLSLHCVFSEILCQVQFLWDLYMTCSIRIQSAVGHCFMRTLTCFRDAFRHTYSVC